MDEEIPSGSALLQEGTIVFVWNGVKLKENSMG